MIKLSSLLSSLINRIKHPENKKRPVIADPALHASQAYGGSWKTVSSSVCFPETCTYHTTGEFARGKYRSHCCPTAFANMILAWAAAGRADAVSGLSPCEVFDRCAGLGRHFLLYWNVLLFHYFGGVSEPLIGLYLRLCLRRLRIACRSVRVRVLFPRNRLVHALKSGHLCILALMFHPVYGSHVVMACGLETLRDEKGHTVRYVRLADGWSPQPRYLPLREMRRFAFWETMI